MYIYHQISNEIWVLSEQRATSTLLYFWKAVLFFSFTWLCSSGFYCLCYMVEKSIRNILTAWDSKEILWHVHSECVTNIKPVVETNLALFGCLELHWFTSGLIKKISHLARWDATRAIRDYWQDRLQKGLEMDISTFLSQDKRLRHVVRPIRRTDVIKSFCWWQQGDEPWANVLLL